jgi:tRNA-modifying protein YgfZ
MIHCSSILSGAIRLTGADRIDFLHGQTTNDIKGTPTPGGLRSLILNAKGQIEFDVRVYRRASRNQEDLYIQTAGGLASDVIARLKRYVVFDDVKLEDISDQIRIVHVCGEGATQLTAGLGFDTNGGPTQVLQTFAGTILASRVNRGEAEGLDLHTLSSRTDALIKWLGAHRAVGIGTVQLEHFRILRGLPDAHRDHFLGMLPQECGLEQAVSYRKGCYIGQEIMARLEARGHTNRHLARARLKREIATGSKVSVDGREVGVIGSCVTDHQTGYFALAVVKNDVPDGASLEVGGVEGTLEFLTVEQPK